MSGYPPPKADLPGMLNHEQQREYNKEMKDNEDEYDMTQPDILPMPINVNTNSLTPSKQQKPSSPCKEETKNTPLHILIEVAPFVTIMDVREYIYKIDNDHTHFDDFTITVNLTKDDDLKYYAIIKTDKDKLAEAITDGMSTGKFMNLPTNATHITEEEANQYTEQILPLQGHRDEMSKEFFVMYAKDDCPREWHLRLTALIDSTDECNKIGGTYFDWKREEHLTNKEALKENNGKTERAG